MNKNINVIIDTNILFRIAIGSKFAERLLDLWKLEKIKVFFTKNTFSEFLKVTSRERFKRKSNNDTFQTLLSTIFRLGEFIEPVKSIPLNSRDPKDDIFLYLAFTGKIDYLISDDMDLLILSTNKRLTNFKIVSLLTFFDIMRIIEILRNPDTPIEFYLK